MVKLARLRELRERKALTQQELATLSGVSRPTITRLEGGADQPFPSTTRKLAKALGVEPGELMPERAERARQVLELQMEIARLEGRIALPLATEPLPPDRDIEPVRLPFSIEEWHAVREQISKKEQALRELLKSL